MNDKNIELSESFCAAHREEGGNKCLTRQKYLTECFWVVLNTLQYSHPYCHTGRIIKWENSPLTAISLRTTARIWLQLYPLIRMMNASRDVPLQRAISSLAAVNFSVYFSASTCDLVEFAHLQQCAKSRTTEHVGKALRWFMFFSELFCLALYVGSPSCSEHCQEPTDPAVPCRCMILCGKGFAPRSFLLPAASVSAGDSHCAPDSTWSNSSLLQTWFPLTTWGWPIPVTSSLCEYYLQNPGLCGAEVCLRRAVFSRKHVEVCEHMCMWKFTNICLCVQTLSNRTDSSCSGSAHISQTY